MRDAEHSGSDRSAQKHRRAGRPPATIGRPDDEILEDVEEALMSFGDLDASEIEVVVRSGQVTLSGTVDDRYAKRIAEDAVDSVLGVTSVRNSIRIRRNDWVN